MPLSIAPNIAQNPVAYLANRMAEGTSVTVDWRGDSTYYGYLMGGTRASPTPIATAQEALRAHYNNTAATFLNNGVSGWGTATILADWDNQMNTIASDAVVIGYGVNDAQGATSSAITADAYADNLRAMTRIARAHGKIVIFETPVPFWDYGSIGTQTKSQRGVQFAQAMRIVAAELSVPLIDTARFFEDALRTAKSPILLMNDGIHPTQEGYNLTGYFKANFFMRGVELSRPGYVAALHPSIRHYGGVNDIIAAAGSRTGAGRIANKISIPILITQCGLDVFIATPRWASGTDVATIKSNGTALSTTVDLLVPGTGTSFYVDAELMVMRNATPGAYLIEVSGEGAEDVGLYYVRTAETRDWNNRSGSAAGSGLAFERWQSLGTLRMQTSAGNTGQNHGLTEVSMSSLIAETAVEFEATLSGDEGVSIFGSPKADNAFPQGGYVMFLDSSTGYLTLSWATAGSYSQVTAIGASDLRGIENTYRLTAKVDGTLEAFVDGVSVGTYSPTKVYRGGFLGVYANGASKTVELRNVRVR